MANNYTRFSEEIRGLTPEEDDWLQKRYQQGIDDDWDFEAQTVDRPDGTDLWIFARESGNPEHVAEFIREFLRKFRPDDKFTMTWAEYCDKPRVGEFGGGVMIIDVNEITMVDAHGIRQAWLQHQYTEDAVVTR